MHRTAPPPPDDTTPPTIHAATPAEAEACSDVEREASFLFRDTPHAWLAGQAAEPAVYVQAARHGALLVARDASTAEARRRPVGFVLTRAIGPEALYIGELGVLPSHQGHRLGARLLDAAAALARGQGRRWLVLRTFTDVPWNAPYYRRLGFAPPPPGLSETTLTEMARIAAMEAEHGLSESARVFLARAVDG